MSQKLIFFMYQKQLFLLHMPGLILDTALVQTRKTEVDY